jgi:hypothetical protein
VKLKEKIRSWRLKRRQSSETRKDQLAPLREFVYLDEVSVYSLLSSRRGAPISEFTSKESSSLNSQISSSLGANVHALSAQLGSQIQSTQGTETQVVRKSIIQSTFRELRNSEASNLVIKQPDGLSDLPLVSTVAELTALSLRPPGEALIIDVAEIQRGRVLEIEVELGTEALYEFSATLKSILEIFDENPLLGELVDRDSVKKAEAMGLLFDKLLVGLIPLEGRAVNYRIVNLDGKEFIVHRQLLANLPPGALAVRDLTVAAVAEASLFWKDIRRLLFSNARYTMLCRVGKEGLADGWTAVKLIDVLSQIVPNIGSDLEVLKQSLESNGSQPSLQPSNAVEPFDTAGIAFKAALIDYASRLAAHIGETCDEQSLVAAGLLTPEHCAQHAELDEQRAAFKKVTDHVLQLAGNSVEAGVQVDLRRSAMSAAGFTEGGTKFVAPALPSRSPIAAEMKARYLDTEVIAIYW